MTETRPFNMEHAKAGAPYACRDGREATVLKWEGRNKRYPLIGVFGANDSPTIWTGKGMFDAANIDTNLDLVMTPLGHIDGRPVFMGDSVISEEGKLVEVVNPGFPRWDKCRWPKQYPETTMTRSELLETARQAAAQSSPFAEHTAVVHRAIANAALRHAIDSGQVVVQAHEEEG